MYDPFCCMHVYGTCAYYVDAAERHPANVHHCIAGSLADYDRTFLQHTPSWHECYDDTDHRG